MPKGNKATTTIGSKEFINFPDLGLIDVPAKVDTGADSSAIWASDIQEKNGRLSYVLFDKNSSFYTGKRYHTKDYSVSVIKNSFGHAEFRYKIQLKIVVAGRTIQAKFTLANRERNRFPILLGRRTIHGKFLVDVSLSEARGNARALFLVARSSRNNVNFALAVEDSSKKAKIELSPYNDLFFSIDSKGVRVIKINTDFDIAKYDIVYFKTLLNQAYIAAAVASYLNKREVKFIDTAHAFSPAVSKLQQYVILADNYIPVPKSAFVTPDRLEDFFDSFKEILGLPFILKDIEGKKGNDNFLVDGETSFKKVSRYAKEKGIKMIAQEYIDNDRDFRVLVFGGKASVVIERKRHSDSTHLNNISAGAEAALLDKKELPGKVLADCIFAARLLNRQVAGVDVVQDKKSGMWYCLEVNEGPQLASGAFTEEKQKQFAKYLDSEIK